MTFDLFGGMVFSDALFMFYLVMAVLFLGAMAVRCVMEEKERGWIPETIGLFLLMAVFFYLFLYSPREGPPRGAGEFRIFLNLLYILEVVGLIVLGFLRRYPPYVNIGLLFFSFDVIARYFDFFWELLPRSLFFILGGLLLLFGGIILERKRRKILSSFKIEEAD